MININDWQLNKARWLDTDFALMTSDEGWKKRTQKKDVCIWQRSFLDDKNDLFRWRLPRVAAPHSEVFDVFVNNSHYAGRVATATRLEARGLVHKL